MDLWIILKFSPDRIGNIFEHLVLQLILSEAKAAHKNIQAFLYRIEGGAEIDFILEFNQTLF